VENGDVGVERDDEAVLREMEDINHAEAATLGEEVTKQMRMD